jgi:hypothetical protein
MSNIQQAYTGQTFNHPVYINGSLETNPQIVIGRKPFLLEKYDFDKLIKDDNPLNKISDGLMGATLGLFVNLLAKLIGSKINPKIPFDEWEVYAFILSFILMLISMALCRFIPSERKRIIKKAKAHFDEN